MSEDEMIAIIKNNFSDHLKKCFDIRTQTIKQVYDTLKSFDSQYFDDEAISKLVVETGVLPALASEVISVFDMCFNNDEVSVEAKIIELNNFFAVVTEKYTEYLMKANTKQTH